MNEGPRSFTVLLSQIEDGALASELADLADPTSARDSAKAMAAALGCTFASPSQILTLSRGLSLRVNSSNKTLPGTIS